MPLARQALAAVLLAAAGSALAAPASAPEAGQAWQAYPQQYPLPQFVGGGTIPGERPRGAAPGAPAALPARAPAAFAATPATLAPAPPRCDAGLEPGGLRPKAGIRSVPDLSAPVVSWNTDWSRGCFSPEAGGYRRVVLADGRTGHVKDELVEVGVVAAGSAAYAPAPTSAYVAPAYAGAAPQAAVPAVAEHGAAASPAAAGAVAGLVAERPPPSPYPAASPYPAPAAPEPPRLELMRSGPGFGVAAERTLESDRIRQAWLARGGNIGAVEFSGGASFMYKFTYIPQVVEMTMTGVGFNLSTRFSRLVFSPPQYERQDRSWGAFKFGAGTDFSYFTVSTESRPCYVNGCLIGGETTSTSSMTSFSLVGTLGFTRAIGRFTSPTKWSGVSFGVEWAPSYTMTSTSASTGGGAPAGGETTQGSFNATGFAVSIEGGSLEALTAKLAKKAHLKLRFFMLPPVNDLPLLMNFSVGAVLY
jgi:hypothetical protein